MRVHVVSDVHGRVDALAAMRRRGRRARVSRGPHPLHRLRRPRPGHLRRPVRRTARRHVHLAAHPEALRRGAGVLPAVVGVAGGRPAVAHRGGGPPPVQGAVRGHAHARVPHVRQRRHPAHVGGEPPRGPARARRGDGRARRLAVRLRRRRPAHPVPHAARDRRRDLRRQGRGRGRGRRPVLPHPMRPCPNCSTTPWRAASSGAARRCWRPSATRSRATCCSATSTSRSYAGRGSAAPNASTSGTFALAAFRTFWSGNGYAPAGNVRVPKKGRPRWRIVRVRA